MKRMYTTAQGKQVSMETLRLSNEETIAVGNMKVNARGDQLGPGGVPEKSRQAQVNEYYNLHTPVAGASASNNGVVQRRAAPQPQVQEQQQQPEIPPSADPLIDEQDAVDIPETSAPRMRGSLADAVAKKAVVNQELLKPLKQQLKDKGPSRI